MAERFRVILADPPWTFGDKLSSMKAATPRSAESNYPTLTLDALMALPVMELADDATVLALWTPCSMLQAGLDVMGAWGFRQVQEWIWVKLTSGHEEEFCIDAKGRVTVADDAALRALAGCARKADAVQQHKDGDYRTLQFNLPLAFGMGRLARAAKESLLIGVRGRPYKHLKDKRQRDVFFAEAGRHSEKPECFQDALESMFPEGNRLELFARRERHAWTCIGNEAPATTGEDIRDSIKRLLGA